MDVESIQETAHSPYFGPWSAWSPWRTIWLQSVVDGPWETVTDTWTATQREYRTVTHIVDILEATPWKMAVLPTMYVGDRVHLDWRALAQLPAVKLYRAAFDGEPLEGDEYIPPGALAT